MQLIYILLNQNCDVTFCSTATESAYMADLAGLGVSSKAIALNAPDFDVFISGLHPSIVIFDRFLTEEQFGWRVAKHCPEAITILDAEDLHCLRRSRQKALKQNREFALDDLLDDDDAKREIAAIWRCDLTLMISEFEMQLLTDVFKVDPLLLHYLPLLVDEVPQTENLPSFEDRQDFIFIGNFFHEPNVDAVRYLKEILWLKIHALLPDASLHIYGAYPSESILQMHKPKAGFYVHGRVQNAATVVKNTRIVLAPLRFGAGIKGKLLEAMQCGTPSITTSIGAEAMHGDLPWNGFISNDPEAFAKQAAALYNDKNLWIEAQRNGFEIIRQRYLKSLFEEDFVKRISALQKDIKQHRKNNFIGAMLQFHTLRSTEYLSRWIEEKNKR